MTRFDGKNENQNTQAILDPLYSSVLEPERYSELILAWEKQISLELKKLHGPLHDYKPGTGKLNYMKHHFQQAYSLLDQIDREPTAPPNYEVLVSQDRRPSMLLDSVGRIVTASPTALEVFGAKPGTRIDGLVADSKSIDFIRMSLANLGEPRNHSGLLACIQIHSILDNSAFLFGLTQVADSKGIPYGLMMIAELKWDEDISGIFQRAFGLTDAECRVVERLISGKNLQEISEERNISMNTLRTQTKAIFRKTDTRSQAEVIRLTAALSQFDLTQSNVGFYSPANLKAEFLKRPDNRVLAYRQFGAANGTPVLYLHGTIDGWAAPLFNDEFFRQNNLRVIAPARPAHGQSDANPQIDISAANADFIALLDELRIDKCPVIGHLSGARFAYGLAHEYPERVSGILNVSGVVPIIDADQISKMHNLQRLIVYTNRYVPSFLPFLLRVIVALVRRGGHRKLADGLYETCPADRELANKPDVFEALSRGYDSLFAQGVKAFHVDADYVLYDWSDETKLANTPVCLINGTKDPAVEIGSVRKFAGQNPHFKFLEFPDDGQLIFFDKADQILSALNGLEQSQST